jgi:hypothetical protein
MIKDKYPVGDQRAFSQVDGLRRDGRINMYEEANYSEGITAYMWLSLKDLEIAESINKARENEMSGSSRKAPQNL